MLHIKSPWDSTVTLSWPANNTSVRICWFSGFFLGFPPVPGFHRCGSWSGSLLTHLWWSDCLLLLSLSSFSVDASSSAHMWYSLAKLILLVFTEDRLCKIVPFCLVFALQDLSQQSRAWMRSVSQFFKSVNTYLFSSHSALPTSPGGLLTHSYQGDPAWSLDILDNLDAFRWRFSCSLPLRRPVQPLSYFLAYPHFGPAPNISFCQ